MADSRHVKKYRKNDTTRLQLDRFDETWVVAFHHVRDMSAMMWLPSSKHARIVSKRLNVPIVWQYSDGDPLQWNTNRIRSPCFHR